MLFTSLEFLFLFLPITLAVYFILRSELRNLWLLIASVLFYAWGEPTFVLVMMASIVVNYFVALFINHRDAVPSMRCKIALGLGMVSNISLIGVYKYANFFTGIVRSVFPGLQGVVPQTSILLPIGISFFTFQAMSYLVDVYRGIPAQKNPINLALYIALFPQLIAGPIVRYNTVAEQICHRVVTVEKFSDGVNRFLVGFNKKMLLANLFAATADMMFADKSLSVCSAWLGAFCYTFQIFFDFSGYSDMAIGLGKMFGFEFLENFNYPYISRSITEFWRRWHMSLGTWFRDYLYFPLGGSRVESKCRLVFNLSVVWLATGIWHGANWTFILWGCLYGLLIIIEKLFDIPRKIDNCGWRGWIMCLPTFVFVVLGWVLFRSADIGSALRYLGVMFGVNAAEFIDGKFAFEFGELRILFVAAIAASIPWCRWLQGKLAGSHEKLYAGMCLLGRFVQIPMFVVGISYLAMNAHNPFIYFNF